MTEESKISSGQFFSTLLLSRLLSLLTYTPLTREGINTSDYLVFGAVGIITILISAIPLIFLYKNNSNKCVIDLARDVSPVFAKILSVLYALLFIFYGYSTLERLDLFAGTVIFPEIDTTFFVILAVIVTSYAAYLGLEAVGRAGSISLIIFCISFVFIFSTMADKINLNNFSPVAYSGYSEIFTKGVGIATRTVELAIMAVFFPRVSGNKKKGFFIWLFSFAVILELVFFFLMGGLSEFAFTRLFPVQEIAVLSQFSVFQRLDVILTGVWILSAFIKISFLLYLQTEILKKAFSVRKKNYFLWFAGLLLIVGHLLTSSKATNFLFTVNVNVRFFLYAVFILAIPIMVLILKKIKERKTQ